MHIAFIHPHQAFLPGIQAYRHFFEGRGWKVSEGKPGQVQALSHADVFWYFMGTHFRKTGVEKNRLVVHEYASLSVPPFRGLKDQLKKTCSVRPDYRIFTNEYVSRQLRFNDGVPSGCRDDVGVNPAWFNYQKEPPVYDFIYIGSLAQHREPERMLALFNEPSLREKTVLLLGNAPAPLREKYRQLPHFIFHDPVPQHEIPRFLAQSRFALNHIPATNPFQHLTSTKMLEYCAAKIPVITNSTPWFRHFRKKYGGQYWVLEENQPLSWESLHRFPFQFPDMALFSWENRVLETGIMDFLKGKSN